eukprot:TRINITY_DN973_c0_g1_i2.p1 TRINITY_DN973_c0_g1~~TRINITY_DN973_c0_g1_i2.p1  ORF type:complete len:315 (-),score=0.16 TRINITY_DN973_c0_g1_i2:344-1216(-)
MKPNPSVNCSAHPDREAVDVCNRYPCRSYGLCEECAALHPLLHNGKELKQCKALKKELSSKTVIHAVQGKMIEKFEKKLEKTNVPEDILELYREAKKNYLIVQERIESFRTEVEKLEAALEADTYLEIEPKSFEEISKLFSEIQSKLTGVLNLKTSFHLMGTNTKAIMPFYNLSLGALSMIQGLLTYAESICMLQVELLITGEKYTLKTASDTIQRRTSGRSSAQLIRQGLYLLFARLMKDTYTPIADKKMEATIRTMQRYMIHQTTKKDGQYIIKEQVQRSSSSLPLVP